MFHDAFFPPGSPWVLDLVRVAVFLLFFGAILRAVVTRAITGRGWPW